jgi:hypothetical protein
MSYLCRCLRCPASDALIIANSEDDQTFFVMTHASEKHALSVGQNGWVEGEDYQVLGQSDPLSGDPHAPDHMSGIAAALWIALNPHAYPDPEAEILELLVSCLNPTQVKAVLMAPDLSKAMLL